MYVTPAGIATDVKDVIIFSIHAFPDRFSFVNVEYLSNVDWVYRNRKLIMNGSHDANRDLYSIVAFSENIVDFTVESDECDNTTAVYTAVAGLKVGDRIDADASGTGSTAPVLILQM